MTSNEGETNNVDANNRVTSTIEADLTTSTYTYDDDGNLIKKTYADGTSEDYQYDVWGHMTSYTDRSGVTTVYTYYADGLRKSKQTAGGDPVRAYLYEAYGKVYSGYDASYNSPILYAGQYYDAESGMYYLRARYYSPDLKRFTQEDTHWNPSNMIYGDNSGHSRTPNYSAILQSSNLYGYCINNPVRHYDPTGEIAISIGVGAGLTILGVIKVIGITFASVALIATTSKKIERIQQKHEDAIFYEAWISGGAVKTGRALSLPEAIAIVSLGGSVYSKDESAAYGLASIVSGGEEPLHHDPHGLGSGYKPHYHLHEHKNNAHIWYN